MTRFIALSLVGAAASFALAQPATQPAPRSQPTPASTQPADRSPAEMLRLPLGNVRMENVHFEEALEWLAQAADVNVFVSWKRLATINVAPDMPVALTGENLTVGSFLDLLIADVNRERPRLGYEAGKNLIRVAPRQDLDQELVTRVYPVYELLKTARRPAQFFAGRVQDYVQSVDPVVAGGVALPRPIIGRAAGGLFLDAADAPPPQESIEQEMQRLATELMTAITGSVEPDSWEDNGGRGTMSFFQGMLIVRNSSRVHRILGEALGSPP